jgi:hypothetical protein
MFTWLPLYDLPSVPQIFVERCFNILKDPNNAPPSAIGAHYGGAAYEDRQIVNGDKITNTRYLKGFSLGADWEQWVRENIISEFFNTGFRISTGKNTETHGPHIDSTDMSKYGGEPGSRRVHWKLNYLLTQGGEEATTVFFREKGKEIDQSHSQTTTSIDDYSFVEEIERVKFPLNKWILLNTGVVHGVHHVTDHRINLTVMVPHNSLSFSIK